MIKMRIGLWFAGIGGGIVMRTLLPVELPWPALGLGFAVSGFVLVIIDLFTTEKVAR